MSEYVNALNELCMLAKHKLFVFEKNFDNIGFDSSARIEILRKFLLSNPNNKLLLLAHDASPISRCCPRLITLLGQFGHNMFIFQIPKNLQHLTEPFAVADESSYVRRFHFDTISGVFAENDNSKARLLQSRFLDMWQASQPNASTSSYKL